MDANLPIPHVTAFDISARGRIDPHSGWHAAEKRVNTLALRAHLDGTPASVQPAWPRLLQALGADLNLANRKAAELQPTLVAANRIIDAVNGLPPSASYAELEQALGVREPRESHDRIGDAMNRVMRMLERRREEGRRLPQG